MSQHDGADGLRVRRGEPRDLETVVAYNLALARETESLVLDADVVREGVRAVLSDPGKGAYFVAELAGEVVGQLMVTVEWSDWRNGPMWWIQSVYVHPDHRRRGVFRELYRRVATEAETHGVEMLRLYVEQENERAQRVYRRVGMRPAGYIVFAAAAPYNGTRKKT